MADPNEDLRAAQQAHRQERQSQDDAIAREKAELKRALERYEGEEREVISYLQRVAASALEALRKEAPTEAIPITPKRTGLGQLFPRKRVEGWNVTLGASEFILLPEGEMLQLRGWNEPERISLMRWAEGAVRGAHGFAPFTESPHTEAWSPWGEAFSWTARARSGRESAQATMRARLQEAKSVTVRKLAEMLDERGVTL
jgi:hypothetical protein